MTAQRATRSIACPSCGGSVELRAAGYSVSVVCQYCGSTLDVSHPEVALISKYEENAARLAIPLGSKGTLKGMEAQVIGYMRRSIDGEGWDEYLLFNPYHGYRWLVHDDDGWWMGTMLTSLPSGDDDSVIVGSNRFTNEDGESYVAEVETVVGEFYWRVEKGDTVELTNFESGNSTVARERSGNEVNWTVSEPLYERDMVGFGGEAAPGDKPRRSALMSGSDAVAAKPASTLAWAFSYTGIAMISLMALLAIMIVFSFGGFSSQTYNFQLALDGPSKTVTFGPMTFPGALQKVTIETEARDFENSWIDLDMTLVERTTQESIDVYDTVEHYAGTDSDGSWTEGSHSTSTKVASVPRGTYDLVIEASMHQWPTSSPFPGQAYTVETKVSSGGVFFSNFVLALIFLIAPPIFFFWRRNRSRWD